MIPLSKIFIELCIIVFLSILFGVVWWMGTDNPKNGATAFTLVFAGGFVLIASGVARSLEHHGQHWWDYDS